jgi:tetratricopeptide (TPR) repeat protein
MAVQLKSLHQRRDEAPIVFVSYSHKDEEWKDKLLPQLEHLGRLGILEVWDDRKIKAGVDWYARIRETLSKTRCAVCLISSDFLKSSFCMDEEIPYLLQQRYRGRLELFPILLRDCVWQAHPWLKRWQMLPLDAKPVLTHFAHDPDQVFAEVARQVVECIETGKCRERPGPPGPAPEVDIKRLPQSDELLFGRREELNFCNKAWDDQQLNVVVLVASGGVGKSNLVRSWVESMVEDNYRGAERVFAWSFFSQGAKERVTSADEFIAKALQWFGDETAGQGLSAWDRGYRLAELIRRRRTLLLLDGVEPLQSGYAFDRGKLKDPGLEVLLFELAKRNPGLCAITTREAVTDLTDDEINAAVEQVDLDQISTVGGRALLRISGVEGEDQELEAAVKAFGNHAYAIKLLGAWLGQWHDRHINRAGAIPDLDMPLENGRHPRRVMQAFAERFDDGPKANLLALAGLFDRPADAKAIAALRTRPVIAGLTEHLVDLGSNDWNKDIEDLRHLGLFAPASHHAPDEIDAHPLVREHFGERLRTERPEAWRAGHGRLYEHLRDSAKPLPDTLAEMAPLFQAVHHGCQAGRHEEALREIYQARIQRGQEFYSTRKLGALGANLAALSGFFESRWDTVVPTLSPEDQASILRDAGWHISKLERLDDALRPLESAREIYSQQLENHKMAAECARILSNLQLLSGHITDAIYFARLSIDQADRLSEWIERFNGRAFLARAMHHSGDFPATKRIFVECDTLLQQTNPGTRLIDVASLNSYWAFLIDLGYYQVLADADPRDKIPILENREIDNSFWSLALGQAFLGLGGLKLKAGLRCLNEAVGGFRAAGYQEYLCQGLLARAALFRETGEFSLARRDLDETMRIARRGEMRLFQCDAHLEYARLALKEGAPEKAREHVVEARRLVEETGYGRRRPEVEALEVEVG